MTSREGPDELTLLLRAERDGGWVACDWRQRSAMGEPDAGELDDYVRTALGDDAGASDAGYREVTPAAARHIVAHWLEHSMAYGPPLGGHGKVDAAAEPFFERFGAARYFTNTDGRGAFTPKTTHTFDCGIVAVDAQNIGLLWFADED